MVQSTHYPLNTLFKPAPALKVSIVVNFIFLFLFIAACTVLPLVLGTGFDLVVTAVIGFCLLVVVIIFLIWVQLYYESMWYELREDEMSWKRGVWFRTTGIVPFNRITNLDVKQGPVMRALGISTLAIQTAGYSGQAVPEIRIEGMEHAEELRELIRSLVRTTSSTGDGTGGKPVTPVSANEKILEELIKIRLVLEQRKS
jgi:uncharacterized protein